MPITIDGILNFCIPLFVFGGLAYFLYVAFKEPLDGLFRFIGGLFGRFKEEAKPERFTQKYITYE